jgi:hypothetical protein
VNDLSVHMKDHFDRNETESVITWLCPPESRSAYDSLDATLQLRHPGTGSWFGRSELVKRWLAGTDDILWITGLGESAILHGDMPNY